MLRCHPPLAGLSGGLLPNRVAQASLPVNSKMKRWQQPCPDRYARSAGRCNRDSLLGESVFKAVKKLLWLVRSATDTGGEDNSPAIGIANLSLESVVIRFLLGMPFGQPDLNYSTIWKACLTAFNIPKKRLLWLSLTDQSPFSRRIIPPRPRIRPGRRR